MDEAMLGAARFVVALFAAALLIAGPLVPVGWVLAQSREGGICMAAPPGTEQANAREIRFTTEWWPPRVTCTYLLGDRVLVVRHEAPYRDVAAALMAAGVVLAVAAYAARPRLRDEIAAAR